MRRREFITLFGGAAAVWSLRARAQQPQSPVIGFLNPFSPDGQTDRLRGFRQGLADAGHLEGVNLAIEYRWAEGHLGRLPMLAAELVHRRVVLIAVTGGPTPALRRDDAPSNDLRPSFAKQMRAGIAAEPPI